MITTGIVEPVDPASRAAGRAAGWFSWPWCGGFLHGHGEDVETFVRFMTVWMRARPRWSSASVLAALCVFQA